MKKLFLILSLLTFFSCSKDNKLIEITNPQLTNNPSLDVVCTNTKPLLSFFKSHGGIGTRKYDIQLDTSPNFDSPNFIEYKNVKEFDQYLVEKRVEKPLVDNSRYYWRVRAKDSLNNKSNWSQTRFYVNSEYNKHFMHLSRANIENVEVSTSENPKNLIDYDDPGQVTFWSATPPGPIKDWVKFDLGQSTIISRIWMLATPDSDDGWLTDFIWQKSSNGSDWEDILDSKIKDNDTFRNIIDIKPIETHYLKLKINKFRGVSPQLNCVIFYTPKEPEVFKAPDGNYVLLIGDQMNGGTYTQLAEHIQTLGLNIKTIKVPHYEISLDILNKAQNKPIGIIFSGNDANYPNLPMFEYNGVYELIREADIPMLGICAGHQMLAFAYGYSFVRSMGWEDLTAMEKLSQVKPIHIIKEDPIYKGIKNPFIAPEIHGWAIGIIPEDFELLAESTYIQNIKHKTKFIYGTQFHPEVQVPYNEGKDYLTNFLKMALEKKQSAQ